MLNGTVSPVQPTRCSIVMFTRVIHIYKKWCIMIYGALLKKMCITKCTSGVPALSHLPLFLFIVLFHFVLNGFPTENANPTCSSSLGWHVSPGVYRTMDLMSLYTTHLCSTEMALVNFLRSGLMMSSKCLMNIFKTSKHLEGCILGRGF